MALLAAVPLLHGCAAAGAVSGPAAQVARAALCTTSDSAAAAVAKVVGAALAGKKEHRKVVP